MANNTFDAYYASLLSSQNITRTVSPEQQKLLNIAKDIIDQKKETPKKSIYKIALESGYPETDIKDMVLLALQIKNEEFNLNIRQYGISKIDLQRLLNDYKHLPDFQKSSRERQAIADIRRILLLIERNLLRNENFQQELSVSEKQWKESISIFKDLLQKIETAENKAE